MQPGFHHRLLGAARQEWDDHDEETVGKHVGRAGVRSAGRARAAAGPRRGRGGAEQRRHPGQRHERQRTGGGRLGDCRDRRPRHRLPQDRRNRRRRTLRAAGAARRHLRHLGPRLRPGRLRSRLGTAGPAARPDRRRGAHAASSGTGLPLQLLARAHRPAGRARVSGHRPRGQWHQPAHGQSGRVDQQPQGLPALPPGRQRAHPRDPRPRRLRLGAFGLGRPRAARPARRAHEQLHHRLRPRARPRHAGGLEQPHRGRSNTPGTATAAGHRAQRGHHHVELGQQRRLRPRRDRHRQAQPAGERRRPAVRRRHRQRLPAGDRHARAPFGDDQDPAARARPARAVDVRNRRVQARGATSAPRRSGTTRPTRTTR